MSRQNKVNPGMYTQRGRLTQDDAARELRKQASVGSQYTWQPVQKDARPRPTSIGENANRGAKITADSGDQTLEEQPAKAKARTVTAKPSKASTAKAKTASAKTAKKTGAKAKSAGARKSKAKSAAPVKRKAVLARNVGGGGPKPRQSVKRRRS